MMRTRLFGWSMYLEGLKPLELPQVVALVVPASGALEPGQLFSSKDRRRRVAVDGQQPEGRMTLGAVESKIDRT